MSNLDADIEYLPRNQLKEEIRKLRNAIRTHRDSTGHGLCWYHPELWNLLPEKITPVPQVPPVGEFLARCREYHESLKVVTHAEREWRENIDTGRHK